MGREWLTVMRIMDLHPGTCALPQLRYGFALSAYEGSHMHDRDE